MTTYAESGVDIDAGSRAVRLMRDAIRRTYTSAVLSDVGSFGGLYALQALSGLQEPVLVASTDGVGTKTKVASRLNRWDTIGQDLVNHCVNDILVQGADPLFFLDYIATSKLIPEQIATIVSGMAAACERLGIALLGGETAEMPDVYLPGEVDVAGTIVGIVERRAIIDGRDVKAGDLLINLPSSGLHTNGYSLARRVLDALDWSSSHPLLGDQTIGEALLAVHRPYLHEVKAIQRAGVNVKALAHITGGGIVENLPRVLPPEQTYELFSHSWQVPPIFRLIQQEGSISDDEMMRVFNMGLGMIVVVEASQASTAVSQVAGASIVGRVVPVQHG
jgi:phosphoribosylformylglycinamidine cyclo-ligase